MVQGRLGLVVGEAVEVPVGVAAEHDGRGLGRGDGDHADVPVHAAERVGHVRDDLAGEALLAIGVHDGEGDAALGVRHDGEVAPAPAVLAAVKAVEAVRMLLGRVVIGRDVVGLPVNLKGAVLDTVGVPSGNIAVVGVLLVKGVVGGVVPAGDNVPLDTVLVLDVQVGDGGTVGNEGRLNAVAGDPVLAVLVRLGRGRVCGSSAQSRESDEAKEVALQLHLACLTSLYCAATQWADIWYECLGTVNWHRSELPMGRVEVS